MNIQEDYVSFETVKLLKEKGFEGYSILTIYDENAAKAYIKELREKHLPFSSDDPKLKEFHYTKPTIQMAMKWLREVHHIFIQVELYSKYNDYCFELFQNTHRLILEKHETFNNYEEACEAAIKYCLQNLI